MLEKLVGAFRKAWNIYENIHHRIWANDDYYSSGDYFNREGFDLYVREVQKDIRDLRHFISLPESERNQDTVFSFLIEKYRSNYCPSAAYKFFSDENKLEYCYKRVEIDELLAKAESPFSDFLSEQ